MQRDTNTFELTRRAFLRASVAGVGAAALAGSYSRGAQAAQRPNIVYILADDMGYGDLRCYHAESQVPTPRIDALAGQGRRFTDAHSPCAVCTPTRYAILTGRYCWRTRLEFGVLWGNSHHLIEPERPTVASYLKGKGYATGCIGKWHLGLGEEPAADYEKPLRPGPNDCGFDYFFGVPASLDMAPYCYVENDRPIEPLTAHTPGSKHEEGGYWREGAMSPSFKHDEVLPKLTEKAVRFISDRSGGDSPFFLYLPLTAPHTPWLPTGSFAGSTPAGNYGDFVAQVDASVGQVLDALDAHGLTENTLVIFTSDNGADARLIPEPFTHEPNAPLRGQKADIWEGGHRIPFIARWPGHVPAGTTTDELVCLTDLFATCTALVGDEDAPEAAGDTYNVLPALLGATYEGPLRPFAIHQSSMNVYSVRRGDWKFIPALGNGGFGWHPAKVTPEPGGPTGQLYNMAEDPAETKNLFLDEPDLVRELGALIERARSEPGLRAFA